MGQASTRIIRELQLQMDEVRDDGETRHLRVTEHHLDDCDVREDLGYLIESDRPRVPLSRVTVRDVRYVEIRH